MPGPASWSPWSCSLQNQGRLCILGTGSRPGCWQGRPVKQRCTWHERTDTSAMQPLLSSRCSPADRGVPLMFRLASEIFGSTSASLVLPGTQGPVLTLPDGQVTARAQLDAVIVQEV